MSDSESGLSLRTYVQFTDPSIREQYTATLPSREERRENMSIIPLQCSNFKECGKTLARVQLKVCSRCKQARYCSPQCQKAHWRTEHKKECEVVGLAPAKDIALKLVERLLAAPNLTRYFYFHSILTLDLIQDRSNASHYAVKVECDTQVADLAAHLRRMMAGQARDPTAQVLLCVTEISRVLMDEAPERTRIAAADAIKRFEDAKEEGTTLVILYFTTKAGGGTDGSYTAPLLLPDGAISYMATNPKETLRSAMFGESQIPLNERNLRECLNNEIRMDDQNKLRLRAYPTVE